MPKPKQAEKKVTKKDVKQTSRGSRGATKEEKEVRTAQKVTRALTDPPKSPRSKPSADNSTIPLVSELSDSDLTRRAGVLLTIAMTQTHIKKEAEEAIRDCKDELSAMCLAHDLSGLRYGLIGMHFGGYKRRSTFSADRAKKLMLEAGVDPEEIGKCYVEGEEYLDTRLVELS